MFLNLAYAQNAQGSGGFLVQLLPLILIFVVFYFLLIRPQQKRVKQHKDMVGALKAGNYVVTSGGIISKVIKIIDDELMNFKKREPSHELFISEKFDDGWSLEEIKEGIKKT